MFDVPKSESDSETNNSFSFSSNSLSETSTSGDSSSSPGSDVEVALRGSSDCSSLSGSDIEDFLLPSQQTHLRYPSSQSTSPSTRRARILEASRIRRRRESAPASPASRRRATQRRGRILRASRACRRRESAPTSLVSGRNEPALLARIRRRREQRRRLQHIESRDSTNLNTTLVTSDQEHPSSDSDEDVAPPSNRRYSSLGVCLYRVATEELQSKNGSVLKATDVKAIPHQHPTNHSMNTYAGIVVSRSSLRPYAQHSGAKPSDDEEKVCIPTVPGTVDDSSSTVRLPVAYSIVPRVNSTNAHENINARSTNKTISG